MNNRNNLLSVELNSIEQSKELIKKLNISEKLKYEIITDLEISTVNLEELRGLI